MLRCFMFRPSQKIHKIFILRQYTYYIIKMPRHQCNCPLTTRLVAFLLLYSATTNNPCWGFSVVVPTTTSSRKPWQTNDVGPIASVSEFPIAKSPKTSESLSSTMMQPALTSPLFGRGGGKTKPHRSNQRLLDGSMIPIPSKLKFRILQRMLTLVHEDIEQAQASNSLLSAIQAGTIELNKTARRVGEIKENLDIVWHAAGQAMIDFGLGDFGILPLPAQSKTKSTVLCMGC